MLFRFTTSPYLFGFTVVLTCSSAGIALHTLIGLVLLLRKLVRVSFWHIFLCWSSIFFRLRYGSISVLTRKSNSVTTPILVSIVAWASDQMQFVLSASAYCVDKISLSTLKLLLLREDTWESGAMGRNRPLERRINQLHQEKSWMLSLRAWKTTVASWRKFFLPSLMNFSNSRELIYCCRYC